MSKNKEVFNRLRGGLIVSCQALKDEPLYSSYIMSRMAYAAKEGGAVGIRANTPEDIREIKKIVDLPVIGLYKQVFDGCNVFITPTIEAIDALMEVGPEIIALDATDRPRPNGESIEQFFTKVRRKYPDMLFMADCATVEEGIHAAKMGFDVIGTTLSGYTENTCGIQLPNISMMEELVQKVDVPVIAEGGIWAPEELKQAMDAGVLAAVIGTAITRPRDITKRFVAVLQK